MNKPIHPAVAEHVMEENERLRGLLRECHAYLEPVHERFMRAEKHEESSYVAGANLHAAIDAAISQQAEPLYVTHRPLIRNAINLLGMRRPVAPDVQRVIDDLEAMLGGQSTPAGAPSDEWLQVAKLAEPASAQSCTMGVDCEKYGCYAAANGEPDRCGKPESAPAQDEREVISSYCAPASENGYGFGYVDGTCIQSLRGYRDHLEGIIDSIPGGPLMPVAQHERILASLTRPAQTEQQPVAYICHGKPGEVGLMWDYQPVPAGFERKIDLAPIAQTAPQPEQSGLPQELFDGYAVYQETVRHRRDNGLLVRTSPENVSDTLDAVARLIKARRAAPET